jgi:lipid-A-disaccharide synthase-like uncharacterized protein
MSPAEQTFLVQVLIAAGVLFVIGFIGNVLSFSNRFVNALVTAIIFVLVYGGIVYAGFVSDQEAIKEQIGVLSQEQWIRMIGIAGLFVFVIDLVANMLSFQSRFMNALMTAIVFLVLFGGLMYFTGGIPNEIRVPA